MDIQQESNKGFSDFEKRFNIKSVKDIFKPREKRKYLINQLVQEGTLNMWFGKFGSKKTFSAIIASVSVASGNDFIGLRTIQSPILYINEDSNGDELEDRFQKVIGEDYNENLPVFYLNWSGLNFFINEDDPKNLYKLIKKTNAKLVFIDTFAAIMSGGNENEVSTIQPIFLNFRKICEKTNCAIVVLHHANKNDGYRGSSAIAGALDTMVRIESDFDRNIIKFMSEKVRSGEPFSFSAEIHFEDELIYMTKLDSTEKEKTKYQKEIIDYCQKNNGELSLNEFLNSVPPEKMNGYKSEIYRMAKHDKTIEKDPDSKYGNTKYKLVKSFK